MKIFFEAPLFFLFGKRVQKVLYFVYTGHVVSPKCLNKIRLQWKYLNKILSHKWYLIKTLIFRGRIGLNGRTGIEHCFHQIWLINKNKRYCNEAEPKRRPRCLRYLDIHNFHTFSGMGWPASFKSFSCREEGSSSFDCSFSSSVDSANCIFRSFSNPKCKTEVNKATTNEYQQQLLSSKAQLQ